jgi:hypothetical protein
LKIFNRIKFILDNPFVSIYVIYLLIVSYYFLNSGALVPDEVNFIRIGEKFELSRNDNPEFFGQIFWLYIKYIADPLVLRTLSLFYFIGGGFLIAKCLQINVQKNISWLLLLWLSMPISFWTGKLIGPELLNFFLLCLVIYRLHFRLNLFPTIIIYGISVGIKLDVITSFPLIGYLIFTQYKLNYKSIFFISICFLVGFFAANPTSFYYILINIYNKKSVDAVQSSQKYYDSIFGYLWSWDAIQIKGLFNYSISFVSFLLFSIYLLIFNKINFLLLFAVFIFSWWLVSSTAYSFIWYWFSFIICFMYIFVLALINSSNTKCSYLFAVLLNCILIINFILNSSFTYENLSNKWEQIKVIHELDSQQQYLLKLNKLYKPELIVDFTEFGYYMPIKLISDLKVEGNEGLRIISSDDPRKSEAYGFLWKLVIQKWLPPAITGDLVGCMGIQKYNKILILVGQRLIRHQAEWNGSFLNWSKEDIGKKCGFPNIVHNDFINGIQYLMIQR